MRLRRHLGAAVILEGKRTRAQIHKRTHRTPSASGFLNDDQSKIAETNPLSGSWSRLKMTKRSQLIEENQGIFEEQGIRTEPISAAEGTREGKRCENEDLLTHLFNLIREALGGGPET
jgi:hypothetical protein